MGAGPPARDPPKPAAPGLTCPDLCQATLLTGNAGALKRPEAKAPVIMRTNVCNERAYCVPGCPHPASPASTLFGKTCPSCLLGQIPGQAAQPAGETWRAGRTAPPALPPEEVTPRAGQLSSTLHLSEALQVRLGSPGRPSSLAAVSRPPPHPPCSQQLGWGGPRSVGKRLPLASA